MASTQTERTLAEIANKIKQSTKELCCLNTSLSGISSYEYIPKYEVAFIAFPEFKRIGTGSVDRHVTYDFSSPGTIVFRYDYGQVVSDLNLCGSYPITDEVISFFYEDSTGRVINSVLNTNVTDYFEIRVVNTNISYANINFKVILKKASGFIIEFEDSYVTESNGAIVTTDFIDYKITSNTNKNYEFTNYAIDYSDNYYILTLKSFLEERLNNNFVRHIDNDGVVYVPTACTFYEKPDSLQPYTPSKIDLQFNQIVHQLVTTSASYSYNTLHTFSVTAISGTVQLSIGTLPGGSTLNVVTIPNGTSITLPATGLLANYIEVTVTGGSGSSAYVTLIKP